MSYNITSLSSKWKTVSILILLATIIIGIDGRFFTLPSWLKLLYATFVWLSVFFFPFSVIFSKNQTLIKPIRLLVLILLFLGIFQTFYSFVNAETIITSGSNMLTLFGNDQNAVIFIPPVFIFLVYYNNILKFTSRIQIALIFYFLLHYLFFQNAVVFTLSISVPFLYYLQNRKEKYYLSLVFLLFLFYFILSSRYIIIAVIGSILSMVLPRIIKSNKLFNMFVISYTLIPFVILVWSFSTGISPFELSLANVSDENYNIDTRTFLYIELLDDLLRNNSIWLGKGALSGYYSSFFESRTLHIGRSSVEVHFLLFLLRSGLVYLVILITIIFYAIYNVLKNGRNNLVKSFAIVLATYIYIGFVGDISGCSNLHFVLWIIIGICTSTKWVKLTDNEMKIHLYNKTKLF